MRKFWSVDYNVGKDLYGSYILAKDYEDAKSIIQSRKRDERIKQNNWMCISNANSIMTRLERQFDNIMTQSIEVEGMKFESIYRNRVLKLNHALMFCIDIAKSSGRYELPEDAFSDKGLVHQILHLFYTDIRYGIGENDYYRDQLKLLSDSLPEMFLTQEERRFKKYKRLGEAV